MTESSQGPLSPFSEDEEETYGTSFCPAWSAESGGGLSAQTFSWILFRGSGWHFPAFSVLPSERRGVQRDQKPSWLLYGTNVSCVSRILFCRNWM